MRGSFGAAPSIGFGEARNICGETICAKAMNVTNASSAKQCAERDMAGSAKKALNTASSNCGTLQQYFVLCIDRKVEEKRASK